MKRLIAITTLGLAISFPALSFAFDYMDLYTKPIAKSEVKNEVRGGDVNRDFISFYTNSKYLLTEYWYCDFCNFDIISMYAWSTDY